MKKTLQLLYLLNKDNADKSLANYFSKRAPLDWLAVLAAYHKGLGYFESIILAVPDNGSILSQFVHELMIEANKMLQFREAEEMFGLLKVPCASTSNVFAT